MCMVINRQTRALRMNQKKVVGRNVAIALGIIAITFLVGLVGAVVNYTSIINARGNTIASLNGQVSDLQNQVNDLTGVVNLAKLATWVSHQTVSQPASSYSSWTFNAQYAGYLVVTVESSTTTKTYVEVIYQSHGIQYDSHKVPLNTVGSPTFPVLPSSIEIRVGNTDWYNGATETVTIQYVY